MLCSSRMRDILENQAGKDIENDRVIVVIPNKNQI